VRASAGADALLPGTRIGDYEIVDEVGEGGMGIVYEAVHPVIGKRVAIKLLKSEVAAQPELIDRFVREATAANKISHPSIIDVFGFGELPDGSRYFVMEYLEGESLDRRLERESRLSLAEALPLFRQVADALDAAHDVGIIHRDLKPDNIFLCTDRAGNCRVKILDFGIAKLAASSVRKTQTGVVMGTPLYMSPEQCRGQNVDQRTDVYAFGVVVYRTLVGRYPFDADTIAALVFQHISVPVPRPSAFGAPRDLDTIMTRALAKSAAARYARLGDLVAELAGLGGGDPAAFDRAWQARQARRLTRRTPTTIKELTGHVLQEPMGQGDAVAPPRSVAFVLPDFAGGERERVAADPDGGSAPTELEPSVALVALTEAELPADPWIETGAIREVRAHDGKIHDVAFAPAGELFATASADRTVRLWDRNGRALGMLAGHDRDVEHVAFAPSASILASAGLDGTVRLWDTRRLACLRVLLGHEAAITQLAFSADGKFLASASRDATVRVWTVATGDSRVSRAHRGPVRCLAVAPDGLCVASGGDDRRVRLWDPKSGQRRALRGHLRSVWAIAFSPDGRRLASSGYDGTVREWDLADRFDKRDTPVRIYRAHKGIVRTLAYSPDGEILASAGADCAVRLWSRDGRAPSVLSEHQQRVGHLTFSPDGRYLASASIDGTVRLWNLAKRSCDMIVYHDGPAKRLAFSSDSQLMASCSSARLAMLTALPKAKVDDQESRANPSPGVAADLGVALAADSHRPELILALVLLVLAGVALAVAAVAT
jgi:WD40 repeat protein/tRNA A-37 threonylcarbamoyl transferase component Bud32